MIKNDRVTLERQARCIWTQTNIAALSLKLLLSSFTTTTTTTTTTTSFTTTTYLPYLLTLPTLLTNGLGSNGRLKTF